MDDALELAQRVLAALDEEDLAPFLALCAPDATIAYPGRGRLPYGGSWSGKDGIERFYRVHDAAEEILVFEPSQLSVDGDVVFVLGHFEGRARDTGRTWSTEFVHVLSFRDGLLAHWQAFFDTAAGLEAHSGPSSDGVA